MKKPILLVTFGFPGSGKSYFSERLAKEKGFFHINSDIIRFTLFKTPSFAKEEHEGIFALMDLITERLLKSGISVIYDCNTNFRSHRKRLQNLARKCKASYYLVWIQTDVSIAEKRLLKRALLKDTKRKLLYRPLKLEVLHRLKDEAEKPTKRESIIAVNGHLSFKKQVKALDKILK